MSTVPYDHHHEAAGPATHGHGHAPSFLKTYVFSLDHKIIGLQFLFSTLIWFIVGVTVFAWTWSRFFRRGPLEYVLNAATKPARFVR